MSNKTARLLAVSHQLHLDRPIPKYQKGIGLGFGLQGLRLGFGVQGLGFGV